MPAFTATAPGKIILFGEHAVVYGQPAIAVPVHEVQARAVVRAQIHGERGEIAISAPGIDLEAKCSDLNPDHPLKVAISGVLSELDISGTPACSIRLTSTIPIASGLGSSAAVSTAVIRALAGFLGHPLSLERVSALVYEVEKIHHGTPSGIDNTVVTTNQPVYFEKDQPIQTIPIGKPFALVIGDTGVPTSTADTVEAVRQAYQENQGQVQRLFESIGQCATQAHTAIKNGNVSQLGPLMDRNQAVLADLGVSSPELDRLVESARQASALGAKLSGGGRGGNMIALVKDEKAAIVSEALEAAGATRTIITKVGTQQIPR